MKHRTGWLEVLIDGTVQRTYPLVEGVTRLGRAPDNDIVFPEHTVSGHHAVLEIGAPSRVIDLGSRNGTFVGGERVEGARVLADGESLRIGTDVHLRLRVAEEPTTAGPQAWLWDVKTGRCHEVPAEGGLLHELVGRPALSEDGPFTLRPEGGGAVLEGPDGALRLDSRTLFRVSGCDFELVDRDDAFGSTEAGSPDASWRLTVDLNGPTGAQADVRAPDGAHRGAIRAGNRVALLHLLAVKAVADRESEAATEDAGWVEDSEIMQGVWGRRWTEKAPSSLQVLVHRVRRDLAALGLAGGVIQKRSGWTRLRPDAVQVDLPAGG